ncbi:MAG: exopolyphosphatase [Candidatus Binatia bacterium]
MRLVTRADFDGLVCGAIITLMEEIDSYLFVEPKFMQDGMVEIRPGDIIANLPYHPDCTLWFDHHITNSPAWLQHGEHDADRGSKMKDRPSTLDPPPTIVPGKGAFRLAPSAARVVYEYYNTVPCGKKEELKIMNSERFKYLLHETDRVDAALLTPDDVLHPQGYVLLSMTIDGKYAEDEPYWIRLIHLLRDASLEEVMRDPEIQRRCRQILDAQEELKEILLRRTTLKDNVIFVDLRGIEKIPDGNRFLLYTLFPTGNISLKVADDTQRPNTTAISVGYNIFNTTSQVNVGALMKQHGGGGHKVVGSCRVPNDRAEKAIREILEAIRE